MSAPSSQTPGSVAQAMLGDAQLASDELHLLLGEGRSHCRIRVRSNSRELIEHLRAYFGHVTGPAADPTLEVVAVERPALDPESDLGVTFVDWKREPGKTGRKDSYVDLPGARVIRKVRTGMVFLQHDTLRIAAGPCRRFDNQVINFINTQYMNWLQHRGWRICHASGLVRGGRTLGIAGFSGGGKSTLMLHLLDHPEVDYLTNDRLFIHRLNRAVDAAGIPKLPRVNPGTIVHNPRLHPLISRARREALLELPAEELWHLEEKYDVMIDRLYGPDRITPAAPLAAFLILNWRRDSDAPLEVETVDLDQRRELLSAVMKSPGPFYHLPAGTFYRDDTPLDEAAYLAQLRDVKVYEARGGVAFADLERAVLDRLLTA
ncbi:MAG: HprK-related kinase B [bacterium]|nr:HprK-related kinase B [bacterium]